MKRASQRITSYKRQAWRKYPSAILKPETHSSFKPIPERPLALTLTIANSLCEIILERTDEAIDRAQTYNFIKQIQKNSEKIEKFILDALQPSVETCHQSINCPEVEPQQAGSDFICSGEKPIEKKQIKRQAVSISAFNTPLQQLKQREKICTSSKQLQLPHKRSIRTGLVPLTSVECEEDVRSTLLQTFYRDKFARQDSINQEENLPKPELARLFHKSNQRDKQQFAYDYDGEKIPIICSNSLKNNPLKVLKTFYKVHKDRAELRHLKKTHETIRGGKFPEVVPSNRFLESGNDLYELKKGIEQNVRWGGKLHSIKLITQKEQVR